MRIYRKNLWMRVNSRIQLSGRVQIRHQRRWSSRSKCIGRHQPWKCCVESIGLSSRGGMWFAITRLPYCICLFLRWWHSNFRDHLHMPKWLACISRAVCSFALSMRSMRFLLFLLLSSASFWLCVLSESFLPSYFVKYGSYRAHCYHTSTASFNLFVFMFRGAVMFYFSLLHEWESFYSIRQ